ncbi:hypothetical protein [Hymenobacter daeguensis]
MRSRYSFLLLALALPGAALAQTAPGAQFTDYLTTRHSRPHVVLGVQAAMPVFWREAAKLDQTMGWGFLGVFAGVQLNARWTVQAGVSADRISHSYDIIPGVTVPPAPGQPTGSGQFKEWFAAVPVQVRYRFGQQLAPLWSLEAVAGLTPQWQQYETRDVAALPGQPLAETTTRARTTNLYATAGLAGVLSVGPGAEVLFETALNQRCASSGAPNRSAGLVPTAGVGFRYRFGSLPRHTSYL